MLDPEGPDATVLQLLAALAKTRTAFLALSAAAHGDPFFASTSVFVDLLEPSEQDLAFVFALQSAEIAVSLDADLAQPTDHREALGICLTIRKAQGICIAVAELDWRHAEGWDSFDHRDARAASFLDLIPRIAELTDWLVQRFHNAIATLKQESAKSE